MAILAAIYRGRDAFVTDISGEFYDQSFHRRNNVCPTTGSPARCRVFHAARIGPWCLDHRTTQPDRSGVTALVVIAVLFARPDLAKQLSLNLSGKPAADAVPAVTAPALSALM